MELGRDRDMWRDLPMDALLAPQPKAREKNSAAGEHHARKREVHFLRRLALVGDRMDHDQFHDAC